MKKRILGVAFIMMSLISFGTLAQTQNNETKAQQENVDNFLKSKKGDKVKAGKSEDGKNKERKAKDGKKKIRKNPYESLTLTETQKTQLRELDSRRKTERSEKSKMAKAEKQRRDSSVRAERRVAKKQYLEEVKAIIGPDQYVVYLENIVINGNRGGHHKAIKGSKDKQAKMKGQGRHHADNRSAARTDKTGKMKSKS